MHKFALPISLTLLSFALLFIGIAVVAPQTLESLTSNKLSDTENHERVLYDENFSSDNNERNSNISAQIKESPTAEPTRTQSPYKPSLTPTPTWTGIPEGEWSDTSSNEQTITTNNAKSNVWDGYADKESFCKYIANEVVTRMKQDPPQIDQSNLPPELHVSPDWDAIWSGAYNNCMNDVYQ